MQAPAHRRQCRVSRNTTSPPTRNISSPRIPSNSLFESALAGGGCGAANCGAGGRGMAGCAMPGICGTCACGTAGMLACGICGMCGKPGDAGAAGPPVPGMEAAAIILVYSLGPCGGPGICPCCGTGGIAKAWVAPAGAAYRGGGGGAAGDPGAGGKPDAAGKGGPPVPGGGAWKNRVNSPPSGWLFGAGGAGGGD